MTITSGAYNATWNALAIGNTQVGGFRHRYSKSGREVKFDAVGDTPVDVLQLGTRMFVDAVLMEYDTVVLSKIQWPWNPIHGTDYAAGRSLWDVAKPLVLTACRADINPQTRTYPKAIIATGFDIEHNFSAGEERVTPIRLIILPVKYDMTDVYTDPDMPDGCSEIVFFTETFVA